MIRGLAAVAVVLAAASADAGMLLYAKDGSLWQHAEGKDAQAEPIAKLPTKGVVREIHADDAMQTIVIRIDDTWYALRTMGRAATRKLDCTDRADLASDGRCLLCRTGESAWQVMIFGSNESSHRVPLGAGPAEFLSRARLLVLRPTGIWSSNVRAGQRFKYTSLAAEDLRSSPDGKRAAVNFASDDLRGLYTLRLKKNSTPRRLLPDGRAVAWSRNSKWLLVDYSKAACLIRAVGGQYKCWNRHRPITISGDGSRVFLIRNEEADSAEVELLVAPAGGATAQKPKSFATGVSPAALWLPSAPSPEPKARPN